MFTILTLGAYGLYWLWSVAREAERFDPSQGRIVPLASWGGALTAAPVVFLLVGTVYARVGAAFSGSLALAALEQVMTLFAISLVALLVGISLLLYACWRLFKLVEHHEKVLQVAEPLPAFTLLRAAFVPGLNMLVPYRVQKSLNTLWSAARDGYVPPAAQEERRAAVQTAA